MRKYLIAFLLNRYLIIFQRYSGFCNMQMRCFMTSSTQHGPHKLPQMRNIIIIITITIIIIIINFYTAISIKFNSALQNIKSYIYEKNYMCRHKKI